MFNDTPTVAPGLTAGTWLVDPQAGHIAFRVKSMWGLVDVNGTFDRFEGALEANGAGTTGELVVHTDSLDTKHQKRDQHLNSADFFDSKSHPRVSFTLTALQSRPPDLIVSGDLTVGTITRHLKVPVVIEAATGDAIKLRATTQISLRDIGLTWNKMGMIKSHARVDIELHLIAGAAGDAPLS